MSRKKLSGAQSALALLAVAVLGGMLTYARQATAEDKEEGRVVSISPHGGDATAEEPLAPAATDEARPQLPTYWLGIQGQPLDSAVLRTHLQLADDVGVVVENVIEHSPAEKAGLRRHDVLIAVNGEQITGMSTLQSAVASSEGKPVELTIIRLAKEETVSITPEKTPADLALPQTNPSGGAAGLQGSMPSELQGMLEQMQRGGGLRVFGPGMVMNGQQMGAMQIPGGVEMKITREGNGPATVTVTRGGESWTVKGDDKEALSKLPEDLRPAVEQMLRGQDLGHGGSPNLPNFPRAGDLPELPRQLGQFHFGGGGEANQQLQQRVEELEKQLQRLEQRFSDQHSSAGTNAEADPSNK
jgi:membrane-associated protease RseP (regulator of RpoE activity)